MCMLRIYECVYVYPVRVIWASVFRDNAISLHRGVASIEAEEAVASSLFADLDKPSRVQPRKKNAV